MVEEDKYDCVSELGAEIIMAITSFIIVISVLYLVRNDLNPKTRTNISDQDANLLLSSAYALFLPLMSYLFSQAKQYNSDGRAQVILIWMVLMEIIRIRADPMFTWRLRKSAAQFVRLFWVGFLVCSYTPLHGIRVSLLFLCIYFGVSDVLKGIMFNIAKDSYLIGKNPKIIHNYVERIMLQDDLQTIPLDSCDYIVMGENNHKLDLCSNGYVLREKKSSSEGILTIGRVFQLNSSEDEAFTSAYPDWRDVCLSLALAKMLRRRFAKLPVDEAGCRKSLDFVLKGIIDYIGRNQDIQTDENDGERNPMRVFSIIQEELKLVDEFLRIKVPIYIYFPAYTVVDFLGVSVMFFNGVYLIYTISKRGSAWLSLLAEKAYSYCFFHAFRRGSMVLKIFSRLDLAITILLFVACIYIQYTGSSLMSRMASTMMPNTYQTHRWDILEFVKRYIKDPTNWNKSHRSSVASKSSKRFSWLAKDRKALQKVQRDQNVKQARVYYSSIVDLEAETIFFCIKVGVSILARLPKWIRRKIPKSSPTVICSTDAKEAILKSLRNSGGLLTNGETSLKNHRMDHLIWACQPHAGTTETILVWHIATTLFHNHDTSHSNPQLSQEENSTMLSSLISSLSQLLFSLRREMEWRVTIITSCFSFGTTADPISETSEPDNPFKEQEAALALSSYFHYLVKCFPDLLPDEPDFTEKMYERVQKEILDIPLFFDQKHTTKYRCNYALEARWLESSVVGKGARLANELIKCAQDEAPVWTMLADFWAEMMLFIAPCDNVDGHQKILHRKELITQLWALLIHAGIITRPKPTTQ